jgi:hypothetical protein
VALQLSGSTTKGSVVLVDPKGTESRELEGETCEEVAEGLAFFVALLLDQRSAVSPASPPRPAAGENATPSSLPKETPPITTVPKPTTTRPDVVEQEQGVATPSQRRLTLGSSVMIHEGLLPRTAYGVAIDAETLFSQMASLSALFRATAMYATSSSTHLTGGSAHFAWIAGSIEVCPVRLVVFRDWYVPFCAGAVYGALEGRVAWSDRNVVRTQQWWATETRLGLTWQPRSSRWSGDLLVGAQVPLRRARFYAEPDVTLLTTPPLVGNASLEISFWTL